MTEQNKSFLEVLSAALRGEFCPKPEETQILEKARVNGINPLIANALLPNGSLQNDYVVLARQLTVGQAQRTADFLLLLKRLEACGLRPVVVKGIVCRSLYPEPELRHSADEDLLIRPDDLARYASVLENEAYLPEMEIDDQADEYEYKFRGKDTQLLIELHTSLFPVESGAYGDCARFFTNALERAVDMTIEGLHVRTLAPTDHLLYLLWSSDCYSIYRYGYYGDSAFTESHHSWSWHHITDTQPYRGSEVGCIDNRQIDRCGLRQWFPTYRNDTG